MDDLSEPVAPIAPMDPVIEKWDKRLGTIILGLMPVVPALLYLVLILTHH